jgi:hypothetical protein
MRTRWAKAFVILLIPVLMLAWCPLASGSDSSSDSSSQGAAITVGLLAVVVAVLFIISLKSDINNVFGQAPHHAPSISDEDLASRLSLALDQPDFSRGIQASEREPEAEMANVGLGLRMEF